MLTQILYWDTNEWENRSRLLYEYDENGDQVNALWEWWEDSSWVFYTQDHYTLINRKYHHVLNVTRFEHDDDLWIDTSQQSYTYNNNMDLVYGKCETLVNNIWVPDNGSIFIYDSEENRKDFFGKEVFIYYAEPTEVEKTKLLLSDFTLNQNYPNPFNPTTKISYSIPNQSHVSLKVFDVLGREIASLVNEEQVTGNYSIEFDASNLTSGIYFYRIQAGNYMKSKKMVLLK